MWAGRQGAFSANSPGLQPRTNAYALGPHPSGRSSEKLPAHRPGKLGPPLKTPENLFANCSKTYYKEAGYYRLQPENDTMDPIIVQDGELQILGKVIGLFRTF